MKQQTVNEFKDGLNLDLHPLVTPKTVLTDNLNGTFITYNGNEFCLQNDRGNKQVAELKNGYIPIGIKEHNGILYIVSVNDKNWLEVGTFPSPTYPKVWPGETTQEAEDLYEVDKPLVDEYQQLRVLENHLPLTDELSEYDLQHPVTIEIQDSYDGSVNLILVDGKHKNRIINSGFSVRPNNQFKFVNRNQSVNTSIYKDLNKESELIRTSDILTNIGLLGVQSGGQFKGGNYTFYIKFGDADYNQTDVVAESGIVSVFNGNDGIPSTISGTLLDERTDKMIGLSILGLNHVYSKIYIYYSREYSDTQGYRMTEYGMFKEPIDMVDEYSEELVITGSHIDVATGAQVTDTVGAQKIWLTGFEQMVPIEPKLINVDYHTVDWSRAEAQHSNMLFLGNVGQEQTFKLYQKLKDFTLGTPLMHGVTTKISQGYLDNTNIGDEFSPGNYYSVKNIYNSLGYWPDEYYRFGIVYILSDGSTTPVFNMRGGSQYTVKNNIYTLSSSDNEEGVFKTPDLNVLKTNRPIYFKFTLPNLDRLGEYEDKIKGWFVVRQKRIPNTICQALSIGTDLRSHLPVIWDDENNNYKWYIESFLSVDRNHSANEPGEKVTENKGNALIQIINAPHILRPFLENFESSTKETSTFGSMKPKYLVKDGERVFGRNILPQGTNHSDPITDTDEEPIYNGTEIEIDPNWFYEKREEWLALVNYNAAQDELVQDVDLETLWDSDTPHKIFIWKFKKYYDLDAEREINETNLYYITTIQFVLNNYDVYGGDPFYFTIAPSLQEYKSSQQAWTKSYEKFKFRFIEQTDSEIKKNALLSLDPCVNNLIGGMFDGSRFKLVSEQDVTCSRENNLFNYSIKENSTHLKQSYDDSQVVFVRESTKSKVIDDDSVFSNLAGTGSSAGDFEYTKSTFGVGIHDGRAIQLSNGDDYYIVENLGNNYGTTDYKGYNSTHNVNLVRGVFTPYLGVSRKNSINKELPIALYSIKTNNSSDDVLVRKQDNSEYYVVSKRMYLTENSINVYRGDCYICKVGMRILRNFIDNTAPVTNTIVDPLSWERFVRQKSLYGGDGSKDIGGTADIVDYSEVNLSDLNAVDLGYWVTFPCLSSYNLGLRSLDMFHTDEMALLGAPRSFYPLTGASAINKVGDSYLLNDGLSATVGRKRYNLMPNVPYSKSEFSNRIMFSNVNITDAYTNGYRTFQGVSYKDYDKQYGAITKLISLGQNIFIVMEHGLGLVPVNPKALMQTTTGETVHIYGYGVLPDEMTIISQDYGSKYEHSVIRTPIGIYGIDVDAKKIWRVSDKQGFETISDIRVETYLKDYLKPLAIEMGTADIRTHYNGKKGDLMFTWNKWNKEIEEWELYSICYNERRNLWVTKYDWKPVVSENINDEFYSLNNNSIWDHADDVGHNGTYVSSWYGEPHEFEFEFVVSDPIGVNKIFDNIQIISNNVQPTEMEITVIGDDYEFKRDVTKLEEVHSELARKEYTDTSQIKTTSDTHGNLEDPSIDKHSPHGYYHFDKRLNQSAIIKWQPFKDIYKFGRRLGNIQYKEGSWFAQIEPLLINSRKEARIRDKWAKIRIRYSGENLAIITAIKTLINI